MILFYFVILLLFLIIIYQFTPSVQIFVDDKWHILTSKVKKFNTLIDDKEYEVPQELQPKESVKSFYDKRKLTNQKWGNLFHDGPDKCLPGQCWWINGMLYCKTHPSNKNVP